MIFVIIIVIVISVVVAVAVTVARRPVPVAMKKHCLTGTSKCLNCKAFAFALRIWLCLIFCE